MYRHWPTVAQNYWDRLYNEIMIKVSANRVKNEKERLKQIDEEASFDSLKKLSRNGRKKY